MLVQHGNRKGYVPPQRLDICSNKYYGQVRSASLTLTVSTCTNLIAMCPLFVSSGYLAVGGQRSELVVRELHGNWAVTTTTGGSINNGVTVAETNGEKRLMVSNNDETIKVFSIPSMHLIDNLCLPTAVNGGKCQKIIYFPFFVFKQTPVYFSISLLGVFINLRLNLSHR